jgi:hypothetical protein
MAIARRRQLLPCSAAWIKMATLAGSPCGWSDPSF